MKNQFKPQRNEYIDLDKQLGKFPILGPIILFILFAF